jgi:hypothetical protein
MIDKRHVLDIPLDAEGILVCRPNRFLGIVDIITPRDQKLKKCISMILEGLRTYSIQEPCASEKG